LFDIRALRVIATLLALIATGPARAAECPGKPDALGTSRTLVIDPTEHIRLGMMQYPETLPLGDHEVVLTFDDGPLPPYTTRALDILASECVKATFFLVGRMVKAYPETVRQIHAAGHSIGTHSNSHPFTFHRMTQQQADAEVEGGITAVAAALGDRNAVAPFFRIPGLMRGDTIERYLASRSLMTWSADFPADDWLHISDNEIAARALQRIEARGRGMLLLHDIKPATVLALPIILRELKSRGYRIVHVEPTTPERAKTVTLPAQWLVRGNGRWPLPELSINVLLAEAVLPAPAPASFGLAGSFLPGDAVALPRTWRHLVGRGEVPLPPESPWSRLQPRAEPIIASARAEEVVFPAHRVYVASAGLQDPWRRPFETADIMGFSFPFKLSPM
jgi:peptidoglycan/xylan/chitin deacetylase (PgdA/CDA1 family)